MSKVGGILVCVLIAVMDVVAGILGIQAQIAQNKVKHLRVWIFECGEASHKAFVLGSGAAVLLGIAHVIANLLRGCLCISAKKEFPKKSLTRYLSVVSFILSWIILVVGLCMLVIGTVSNKKSCGFTHHRFLYIGGVLCFLHALFCVASYVFATPTVGDQAKSDSHA